MNETGSGSEPSIGSDPLGPIAEAFLTRLRAGEMPSPEEYAARHPELGDRIRALFPMLIELERIGPSSGDTARWLASGNLDWTVRLWDGSHGGSSPVAGRHRRTRTSPGGEQ